MLNESIDEIVSAFFEGDMPVNNTDWLNKKLKAPFRSLPSLDKEPDPAVVQSILGSVTMETLKEIQQVRTLTDPSEWLIHQAAVVLRCRLILHLFHRYSLTPTILLKSILSQFEEIQADGGIYRIYNEGFHENFRPLISPMIQLGYLPGTFRAILGDEAENRLYQERLIYPAILRDAVRELAQGKPPLEIPVLATWYIRSQIEQLSLSPPSYFLCHVILNQGESRGISLVRERNSPTSRKLSLSYMLSRFKLPFGSHDGAHPLSVQQSPCSLLDERKEMICWILEAAAESLDAVGLS